MYGNRWMIRVLRIVEGKHMCESQTSNYFIDIGKQWNAAMSGN